MNQNDSTKTFEISTVTSWMRSLTNSRPLPLPHILPSRKHELSQNLDQASQHGLRLYPFLQPQTRQHPTNERHTTSSTRVPTAAFWYLGFWTLKSGKVGPWVATFPSSSPPQFLGSARAQLLGLSLHPIRPAAARLRLKLAAKDLEDPTWISVVCWICWKKRETRAQTYAKGPERLV